MNLESTVRNVMPPKVYRHPGGMREERAHLLSSSDGVDYNSGNESASSSSLPRPIHAARSASLQLVAEMDSKQEKEEDVDVHSGPFTDLGEDEELISKSKTS